MKKLNYSYVYLITLAVLCVVNALASLLIGRFAVSVSDLWMLMRSFLSDTYEVSQTVRTVVLDIRLPRVLAALLVGGSLSLTGAAYQGMFRNPMVSPSILGVSAGAGFGASLAILIGLGALWIQVSSFIFGIAAVLAVYLISLFSGKKQDKCLTLVLSGMIVTTVFTALISLLKYVADPYDTLPSIVYWLMGSLAEMKMADLSYIAMIALPGLLIFMVLGWKLDMLSFGDNEARSMGVNTERLRFTLIAIATLMTAAAVSISGIIGWVGLLVPHIARMIMGPKNSILLPASFMIGGAFLVFVDDISRSVSSMEIPLGITTSLIGAPFFIGILIRSGKRNNI